MEEEGNSSKDDTLVSKVIKLVILVGIVKHRLVI